MGYTENIENNNIIISNINTELTNIKLNIVNLPISIDTSNANASTNDIIYGKTAFVNNNMVVGNIVPLKYIPPVTYNQKPDEPVFNMAPFSFNGTFTEIDLSNWDISNIDKYQSIFLNCKYVTNIDGLDKLNVSHLNSIYGLFTNCSNLRNLDVSKWYLPVCNSFKIVFSGCTNITNLNISNWCMNMAENCQNMFTNCYNITDINVEGWNTYNYINIENMFRNCGNLVNINVSDWNVRCIKSAFFKCNNLSDNSIDSIINMCLNIDDVSIVKNLSAATLNSPFYQTNITNDRYQNRWTELTQAGWSY